jgi:DNA-binding MarR family transcriptional regulator
MDGEMLNDYHKDLAPAVQAFALFIRTARTVEKCSNNYLYRKARLSMVKFIVLQALSLKPNTSITELASYAATETHNIGTLVDRMRKEGLVTTRRSRADRRVVNVKLTDKGRETLDIAFPLARDIVDQIMSSMDEADIAVFMKKLGIMAQNANDALIRDKTN